jgi:hypothetical protein
MSTRIANPLPSKLLGSRSSLRGRSKLNAVERPTGILIGGSLRQNFETVPRPIHKANFEEVK